MGHNSVLELDDGNFDDEVTQSEQPVLVEFWDESCLPCETLAKVLEELAETYEGCARYRQSCSAREWCYVCLC